tara:strand:- start:52 stop:444 length:393 start_codon:yes stop_codon:yes gene_type:complete
MSTLKVNTIQDASGGNASTSVEINEGRAKAWGNFKGTDTIEIRDSFNVSSIVDTATGVMTVNLETAMTDTNYALMLSFGRSTTLNQTSETISGFDFASRTTSQMKLRTGNGENNTNFDFEILNMAVFGDQ